MGVTTTIQQTLASLAHQAKLDDEAMSLLWGAFDGDDALQRSIAGGLTGLTRASQAPTRQPAASCWLSGSGTTSGADG